MRRGEIDPEAMWAEPRNGATLEQVARKRHMNFSSVADRLRRNNNQRYAKAMSTHKDRRMKHLNLAKTWKDLESGVSLNQIAKDNRIYSSTLGRILIRNDRLRYLGITERRKPEIDLRKAWIDLENGTPMARIAQSMDVGQESLSERLRRVDESRYRDAIRRNQTRPMKTVSPDAILERLSNDKSLTELSREYGIRCATLAKKLRAKSGDRYRQLIERNLRRARVQTPEESSMLRRLQNGETLTNLARKFNLDPMTLRYRLIQSDAKKYGTIMRRRRERLPPVSSIWKRLEDGESITGLARELGVDRNRLSQKLKRINADRLRKVLENAQKSRQKKRAKFGPSELLEIWNGLEN